MRGVSARLLVALWLGLVFCCCVARAGLILVVMPDERACDRAEAPFVESTLAPLIARSPEQDVPEFRAKCLSQQALATMLSRYKQEYGHSLVDQVVFLDWPTAHERLDDLISRARQTGDVMLVTMPSSWVTSQAARGMLLSLESRVAVQTLPVVEGMYRWRGHLWAAPYLVDLQTFVVRKDLFGAGELSGTLEEFKAAARRVKGLGLLPCEVPVGPSASWLRIQTLFVLAKAAGLPGDLLEVKWRLGLVPKSQLSSPEVMQAAMKTSALMREGLLGVADSLESAAADLDRGRCAAAFLSTTSLAHMSRPERFAVVTPPRLVDDQRIKPVAFIGGDGLAIVAGATSLPDDVARAQIALAWFLEPENWLLRANAIGHLPADHELMKRTRFWPMVSSILQSGRYATYPALPIWATDMEASLVDADFRSLWVEIASGGPANEGVIRDRLEAMDAKVEHAVTREQWATFGLNALRVGLVPALFSLAILLLVIALQRYRIALLREQLRRRDVLAEYIEVLDSMAALPATEAEPLEELEGLLRPELANGPAEEVEEVEGMGRASRERYRRWRELRQKGGHYGSPD